MLVLRRGKNRRTWKKPFWDAGIWTWASMVVSRQREMLWPLCSRPYSPSVPGTSNCISSLSSLSVNSRGVFRKMASKTSDFKPFKVSQMFSLLADLYPTSSATLLWFNSIYISGLRQRESSSGRVTKQRTFISSFPAQVRTNTHIARISTNLMTEWSTDWFIDRFDDWLRDFLLLCTKSRFFVLWQRSLLCWLMILLQENKETPLLLCWVKEAVLG